MFEGMLIIQTEGRRMIGRYAGWIDDECIDEGLVHFYRVKRVKLRE